VGTPLDRAEHLEVCPDEEFPQTISNGSRTPLDIAGSEFTASLPPPRQCAGVSIVGCQSIALSLYQTLRIGVLLGGIACALERAAIAFCDWVSFKGSDRPQSEQIKGASLLTWYHEGLQRA
jgi:hypothetical protein